MQSSWDFFIIPHTHWDREWYAPFEYFHLKLAEVVDGVIDVLERDPDFRSFTLDGQAIVLEDYVEIRPENEARLRALLETGRIEVGPSYVLPDEFLVGAESLVRNLLIGRAVCRRFGAEPSSVGYLPDSFGHPLQLPQVLAGFGLRSFIFSRGMGDELDSVGNVFRWTAPDGSEVLAFQQLADYGNFASVRDADDAERRIAGIVERFGSALVRAGVRTVLLCNGTDHLPVMPGLPALRAELEDRSEGSSFRIASYAEYVDAVGDVDVPAWSGELLGSRLQNVLRGVNSARLYVKRANHRAEQRLLAVETLAALASLRDRTPPHTPTSRSHGATCSDASRTTRSVAARATRSTATRSFGTSRSSARSGCWDAARWRRSAPQRPSRAPSASSTRFRSAGARWSSTLDTSPPSWISMGSPRDRSSCRPRRSGR